MTVVSSHKKPALRSLFIPDDGFTIVDADLSGADAQVVAAEAEDTLLLTAFRNGLDVHSLNAEMVFGTRFSTAQGDIKNKATAKGKLRDDCKRATHGTNYGASARTIATTLGWTVIEAERFQRRWFELHPGIQHWHRRVEESLRSTRSVSNRFGYRILYFDRVDSLLPEGLAWIPQSTVALATFEGAEAVDRALNARRGGPDIVQWLLQVHDSLVFQIRTDAIASVLPRVAQLLPVAIPYEPPLTIPWKIGLSARSWHHCEPWKGTPP
jgi:DNA polymerase-1